MSSCRQKILKAMSHVKGIRIMKLVQNTGCPYNEVKRNLLILKHEGIITFSSTERKRIFSLNYGNAKTKLLFEVLKMLDTPTDSRQPCRDPDCIVGHQDYFDVCNEII